MARPKKEDPRTEDLRLKVSKKKWDEWEKLKEGTPFEDLSMPEFAYHLMMIGDIEYRRREGAEDIEEADNDEGYNPLTDGSPLIGPKALAAKRAAEKEDGRKTSGN